MQDKGGRPRLPPRVWFVPKVTTDQMREKTENPEFGYEIACAQLCGLGCRMRGYMTIHTQEAYQAWMDEQQAVLAEEPEADQFWQ